jgi:hypothetical protein
VAEQLSDSGFCDHAAHRDLAESGAFPMLPVGMLRGIRRLDRSIREGKPNRRQDYLDEPAHTVFSAIHLPFARHRQNLRFFKGG